MRDLFGAAHQPLPAHLAARGQQHQVARHQLARFEHLLAATDLLWFSGEDALTRDELLDVRAVARRRLAHAHPGVGGSAAI